MTRLAIAISIVLFACAGVLHAAQSRQSYSDRYRVLEDSNVFLKDRSVKSSGRNNPSTTQPNKRNPDQAFIVTGIIAEGDGEYRAYVENIDSYSVLRLAPGDALHKGKVLAIDIENDAIEYEPTGGPAMWIEVGCDLTGNRSAELAARVATAQTSSSDGPGIAADVAKLDPNDPNLTMEQKMKLRRAQQMGGTPGGGAAPAGGAASPGTQPAPAAPGSAPGVAPVPPQLPPEAFTIPGGP